MIRSRFSQAIYSSSNRCKSNFHDFEINFLKFFGKRVKSISPSPYLVGFTIRFNHSISVSYLNDLGQRSKLSCSRRLFVTVARCGGSVIARLNDSGVRALWDHRLKIYVHTPRFRAWHGGSGRTCRIGQIDRKMNPRGYRHVYTPMRVSQYRFRRSARESVASIFNEARGSRGRYESIKENYVNVPYRRRFRFTERNGRLGRRKCRWMNSSSGNIYYLT